MDSNKEGHHHNLQAKKGNTGSLLDRLSLSARDRLLTSLSGGFGKGPFARGLPPQPLVPITSTDPKTGALGPLLPSSLSSHPCPVAAADTQAMHLPCRPCCHQTTGEGPGLYYISLLPKTPPTSLARGALQPSPLHWVLEFPGLAGSRPWRRCRQVYQSSSCCLTAGARLTASQWLEFQPFSLLNTSWALPPTHNKFLSSPASWQCSPGPPTWGHSGTLGSIRPPGCSPSWRHPQL